jgi:hypothetical protein
MPSWIRVLLSWLWGKIIAYQEQSTTGKLITGSRFIIYNQVPAEPEPAALPEQSRYRRKPIERKTPDPAHQ